LRQAHVLPPKSADRVAHGSCRLHRSREGAPPLVAAQAGRKTVQPRIQCAHNEAHARTGTVPKESDAWRTNRPERIAARWAGGAFAKKTAAPEPELEVADGDCDQVLRPGESHRSGRRERRVIARRATTLRSVAWARRASGHVVRLGGNLFRGRLPGYEARTQALHVVAARIRRRTAGKRNYHAQGEHTGHQPARSAEKLGCGERGKCRGHHCDAR
jgi:hypothetical protein